jgi:beta-galactosidase
MANCENAWLFSIDPIDPENQYAKRILDDYYMPLKKAHYHRDIINEEADLSPYRVIICPHMAILRQETRERLTEWVKAGGRLLLGPLVGTRSEEMTAWTDQTFGGLEDLMGGDSSIRFTPHWVEDTIDIVFSDGSSCHPKFWCEGFVPHDGTDVLAFYKGGYGNGHAAVLSKCIGKGRVVTVGAPLEEHAYMAMVRELCNEAAVEPVLTGSWEVLACPRVDPSGDIIAIGLINTVKANRIVTLPSAGIDILSGKAVDREIELKALEVRLVVLHK